MAKSIWEELEKNGWTEASLLEQWIWELIERYTIPEQCKCKEWLEREKVKVTSHKGRLWAKCIACETVYRSTY